MKFTAKADMNRKNMEKATIHMTITKGEFC